jgi:hypothetical protein
MPDKADIGRSQRGDTMGIFAKKEKEGENTAQQGQDQSGFGGQG